MPDNTKEAPMPASNPIQTEPVIAAIAAEKKAAASILPSSPMSKIPARSENSPARQASSKGVASRTVVSRTDRSNSAKKPISSTPPRSI